MFSTDNEKDEPYRKEAQKGRTIKQSLGILSGVLLSIWYRVQIIVNYVL